MSLFGFVFENVVETIEKDGSELEIVPNAECAQDSRVGHCGQGTERDKRADAQVPMNHLGRADPEKNRGRKQSDALQDAVVRHDDEICPEHLFRD